MKHKQQYETWQCLICGKRARGTYQRLHERGWASFCLSSRCNPTFEYIIHVELCPDHDLDSDQVVNAFFSGRSWAVFRLTIDDVNKMFRRAIRDEQKRQSEKRHAPEGYA